MQKKRRKIIGVLLVVIVCMGAICLYLNDGYDALAQAQTALCSGDVVTVTQIDGAIVFMPQNPQEGLIFYPGGKVAHDAYSPLMRAYAEAGMACILLEMPFDLAVFDANAADDYRYLYTEIEDWYLGGHSLGGAMASSYLEQHVQEYKGLILCAAYSTVDFSEEEFTVVSMYGSQDKVLNAQKYAECRTNLSKNTVELIIEGGNHAFFGTYGLQEGDGTATITNESQINQAVAFTLEAIR